MDKELSFGSPNSMAAYISSPIVSSSSNDFLIAKALQEEEFSRLAQSDHVLANCVAEQFNQEFMLMNDSTIARQLQEESFNRQEDEMMQREERKRAERRSTVEEDSLINDTSSDVAMLPSADKRRGSNLEHARTDVSEDETVALHGHYDSIKANRVTGTTNNEERDGRLALELFDKDLAMKLQLEEDRRAAQTIERHRSNSSSISMLDRPFRELNFANPTNNWNGIAPVINTSMSTGILGGADANGIFPVRPADRHIRVAPPGQAGGSAAAQATTNDPLVDLAARAATRFLGRGHVLGRRARRPENPQGNYADGAFDELGDGNDYEALWDLAERVGDVKSKGMTEAEIFSLPVSSFAPMAQRRGGGAGKAWSLPLTLDEEIECKICWEKFAAGERLRSLPCLHRFHCDCIDEWIKQKDNCPICRTSIKEQLGK